MVRPGFQRLYGTSNIALVAWPSGVWPSLNPEDEEVKLKLSKCASRAYSELIGSDIPGPFGARPARLPFLRSSPLSVMKPPVSKPSSPSVSEPLIAKPTRGELGARLEVLAKKKRSVKRKPPTSPKGCPPARGKILKVGASSSPSSAVGAGDSSEGGGGGGGARLEVLAKKKRNVKRKPPTSPKVFPLAQGKILKVGASSTPSSSVGAGDSSGGGGGGG